MRAALAAQISQTKPLPPLPPRERPVAMPAAVPLRQGPLGGEPFTVPSGVFLNVRPNSNAMRSTGF